jgi:hypothetical protein
MFRVFCPRHGTHVLLDATRLRDLASGFDEYVVAWTCWCGEEGTIAVPRRAS